MQARGPSFWPWQARGRAGATKNEHQKVPEQFERSLELAKGSLLSTILDLHYTAAPVMCTCTALSLTFSQFQSERLLKQI